MGAECWSGVWRVLGGSSGRSEAGLWQIISEMNWGLGPVSDQWRMFGGSLADLWRILGSSSQGTVPFAWTPKKHSPRILLGAYQGECAELTTFSVAWGCFGIFCCHPPCPTRWLLLNDTLTLLRSQHTGTPPQIFSRLLPRRPRDSRPPSACILSECDLWLS